MYDENKWNEVNNENEKKNNEQPVNTQNTQNTQNGAQQPQGEHTGRQVYGRLGSGTQNGQEINGKAGNRLTDAWLGIIYVITEQLTEIEEIKKIAKG